MGRLLGPTSLKAAKVSKAANQDRPQRISISPAQNCHLGQTYRQSGQGLRMRSRFDIKIAASIIVALAVATAIIHSIVYLSIEPASLSAAMPPNDLQHSRY
jgi:hypothetical protein